MSTVRVKEPGTICRCHFFLGYSEGTRVYTPAKVTVGKFDRDGISRLSNFGKTFDNVNLSCRLPPPS